MEKQYQQCRLGRSGYEQTAWIEQRGAKAGAGVELLPTREIWVVLEVFDHVLPESMLKEHQQMHRNSLPSVQGMA
ncbi:MAG: hypothetical protein JWP32_2697 [Schumannella sp.]|nr:hypothetical protein [Schumannella sp.]